MLYVIYYSTTTLQETFFMGKESEKLVKKFLESELSGKWENLMTFDFRQLHHSGKFGSPG